MQCPNEQKGWLLGQSAALVHLAAASARFASPKQASAMPARPTPNFFSAARRVTDWARLLASSSNLLFIFPFVVGNFRLLVYLGVMTSPFKTHVTVPVVGEVNMTTSVI